MKKKKMEQVSFCAFGDGDSRITSVWLRREKCGKKEDAETITVYLWSTKLYEKICAIHPGTASGYNVEFVVGNNDLDFYRFSE